MTQKSAPTIELISEELFFTIRVGNSVQYRINRKAFSFLTDNSTNADILATVLNEDTPLLYMFIEQLYRDGKL